MTGQRRPSDAASAAEAVIAICRARGLTIAVAESLTGGLLVAELVGVPGASESVLGGVVAYQAALKHSLLGVSPEVLARHGAVHPDVASQMAAGVRSVLAVEGRMADVGLATTGVAGPGPSEGHPAGTAYVGIALDSDVRVLALELDGDRGAIRRGVVYECLVELLDRLDRLDRRS